MNYDPDLPFKKTEETCGKASDFFLLENERWIMDTEVKYLIQEVRGRWFVSMLFISLYDPMHMLLRKIDHYHSRQKAETFASIFQRGIRKDARGTLKRNDYAYHICLN